jgi:hypothetical protein
MYWTKEDGANEKGGDRVRSHSFIKSSMLSLIVSFLLPFSAQAAASSALRDSLIGEWKLQRMVHQGQPIPLPNPDLNLRFTFSTGGIERLYWDRGGSEFCERFAHYQLENSFLQQEVYAINPANAAECAKDPDMQMGKKTKTKMKLSGKELYLYFQLGEEELIYVLGRQ